MTILTLNKDKIAAEDLRRKRKPLLAAWDILAGNIGIGAIHVTDERIAVLCLWRISLLNLEPEAFDNVPDEVAQFMGGE